MFKFFFKKNFYDGWDNLFQIILSNVFTIALGFGAVTVMWVASQINMLALALATILCAGIFMIPVFAQGANARKIADYNSPSFGLFFRSIPVVWRTAFCFGALFALLFIMVTIGLRYYMRMFADGSMLGLLLAAVLFWFMLICVLALQWFLPFYFLQEENNFIKCVKKSFIIFFDNPAFSFAIFVHNVVLFALSCMLFFFLPGTSGISLALMNALRLRLYKYDWLEKMEAQEPGFSQSRDKRAEVPWDELLAEDKEMLGPRGLKSLIFPWR